MKKNIKNILMMTLISLPIGLGLIGTNNKEAKAEDDIFCVCTCWYHDNLVYDNYTFYSQQDYLTFGANFTDSYYRRWASYDITLFKDDSLICIPNTLRYTVHANGHTFRYCDIYGNVFPQITISRNTIEELTIIDCPAIDTKTIYNISGAGWFKLVNCTMDGHYGVFTNDIFNISNYGFLQLENSTIQNFILMNNTELIDFIYDSNWYSQEAHFERFGDQPSYVKNISSDDNGIIRMDARKTLVEGITFDNCSSEEDGGCIYVSYGEIHNCTFNNCYSDEDGGAVYLAGDYAWIMDSTFNNCSCDDDGGAVYMNSKNGYINNCTFSNNESGVDGGAICINADNSLVANSRFYNNYANDDGGAIYVCVGTDDVAIRNCTFSGNEADDCCDNIDGRSDTEITNCGATIASGNTERILIIVSLLLCVFVTVFVVSYKKKFLKQTDAE